MGLEDNDRGRRQRGLSGAAVHRAPAAPGARLRESFNGKLRDDCLNLARFDTLLEAQVLIERWRCEYNQTGRHNSLGYRPPAPEAAPEPVALARLHRTW